MKGPGTRQVSLNENKYPYKWKIIRWTTVLSINFFFFASYYFDIQILEGTLSASRFLGLHLADPYASLQLMLASKMVKTNLIIGLLTISFFYLLFGGRTFCSWVCPYGFLSEMAEILHKFFRKHGIIKLGNQTFGRDTKYYFFFVSLFLSLITGYTGFEIFNPVGGLSRAIVFGPSIALFFIGSMLGLEILYSKRGWCRYLCPVSVPYIILGRFSPVKVKWAPEKCTNCKECQKVCMVPFVLIDAVNKGINRYVESGECTRCGDCVDVCNDAALQFEIKYLDKLI